VKTVLEKFLVRKIQEYKGPKRGAKRHIAAALSITTAPRVQIARESKTKPGVVSVWRTQRTFREAVEQMEDEFVEYLKPRILELVRKAHQPVAKKPSEEFSDAHIYSVSVRKKLLQWGASENDPRLNLAVLLTFGSRDAVFDYLHGSLPDEITAAKRLLGKPMTAGGKKRIEDLLDLVEFYRKMVEGRLAQPDIHETIRRITES
jgi:hypothetical protein